jgi:hypothetical protein
MKDFCLTPLKKVLMYIHIGSRHDAIEEARQHEELFIKVLEKTTITICYLTTDSCGSVARARRILALRRPQMIFSACQAHQVVV